ncbi:GNAT family N-acetyltransferase [Microvirga sp. W0021]|uniref:GNAT family N-acetyltransferase n=1 Tax=Hohaiivirga grylli TaxID=3133970 RepID=A0ABV0BGT0_9HYPH
MSSPVKIETENFWIRSLTIQDADSRLVQWLNDQEMQDALNLPKLDMTPEKLRQFIVSFNNRNNYILGIFSKAEDTIIGFYTIDVNLQHQVGHLTTAIGDKNFWGKNIMPEIILAIRDYFFANTQVEKLSARVLAKNRRVLFNFIGSPDFPFEARLVKECRAPDGKRLDLLIFSAIKNS